MAVSPIYIRLNDVPQTYPWLTVRYLRQLVAEDKVRSYRLGRLVHFDPVDLSALMVEA